MPEVGTTLSEGCPEYCNRNRKSTGKGDVNFTLLHTLRTLNVQFGCLIPSLS